MAKPANISSRSLSSLAQVKAASERPTVDALLFLPLPGAAGTVSFDRHISIDTETPYVRFVKVTSGDGVYSTGDEIVLVCEFTQPVVIIGEDMDSPSIGLSLGRSDRDTRAVYFRGNGTDEFWFSYTVRKKWSARVWGGGEIEKRSDTFVSICLTVFGAWLCLGWQNEI